MPTRTESLSTQTLTYSQISDLSSYFSQIPLLTPYLEWREQVQLYEKWWSHYSGASLQILDEDDHDNQREQGYMFPLRNNIYKRLCQLHSLLLWGAQPADDLARFWVQTLDPRATEEEADPYPARVFQMCLLENGGNSTLRTGSRLYQVFGGHYFKAVHDPSFYNGVRIESLPANVVYPVWDNLGNLVENYVMYWLTGKQAEAYGWQGNHDKVLYVERWYDDIWEVTLGDSHQIARLNGKELKGANPYMFMGEPVIPFTYIPRFPTGSDYGESLIADIIGLVQEINSRSADLGDAIDESSHRMTWVKNYRGKTKLNTDSQRRGDVMDLGETPPGLNDAELGVVDPPSGNPQSIEFLEWIANEIRQSTHTAAVVLGLDEGSQRSGETMAARALPTVATVGDYRDSWSEGLHHLAFLINLTRRVLIDKDTPDESLWNWKMRVDYYPVLPRDRQQLVTDESTLLGAGLRDPETSIQMLGDVRNPKQEAEKALAYQKTIAEINRPPIDPFNAQSTGAKGNDRRPKNNGS